MKKILPVLCMIVLMNGAGTSASAIELPFVPADEISSSDSGSDSGNTETTEGTQETTANTETSAADSSGQDIPGGDDGELFIIKNGIETPQGDTVIVNGDHGLSVIDESGAETVIDDSQAYSLNTDADGKKIIVDENNNEVSVDESGLITYTDKNGSKVVKDLSQEQEITETSLAEVKTESATLETARSAVEGRRKGSIAAVVCTAAIAVISAAFIAAVKIKRRKK